MDDWLATTREIQTNVYGKDPGTLDGQELREWIRTNILAAVAELIEALDESRWKPWAKFEEGDTVIPDTFAFAREMVDVNMFIANALVSAHITDEDYEEIYRAKWKVNVDRQLKADGYSSMKGVDKCVVCGRSFDDVGRAVTDVLPGQCAKCEKEASGV